MPESIGILIVDDNSGDRALFRRYLEAQNHTPIRVFEAASAIEGLERLAAGDIDCVLMDVRMPAMGGWAAYAEVERRFREVAVVMMSGVVERESRFGLQPWLRPGFIKKGAVTATDLMIEVRSAIARRRLASSENEK